MTNDSKSCDIESFTFPSYEDVCIYNKTRSISKGQIDKLTYIRHISETNIN